MSLLLDFFKKLNDNQLWSKQLTLQRNEYLKWIGTTDTNLYYILSGSLKISIQSENEEQIIRFGYKNNFVTALDSFISEKPSDIYIQALKKTTLKVMSKANHTKFLLENDANKILWNKILEELILQQMERERDLLTASPKVRYQRVFKRSPQLFQEIPNKYIASYLRMTPETLSRLKKS